MSAFRLHYVTHSLIPSQHANGIQVMKNCAAFVEEGAEVTLFCRRQRVGDEELFAHYGLPPTFRVIGRRLPRLPGVTRVAHTALTLGRMLRAARPSCVYGRDTYLLGALARLPLRGRPLALEVHKPPVGRLEERLQRELFASPRFRLLVVISEALAEEYRARFGHLLGDRILLARDGADERPETASTCAPGSLSVAYVGSLAPGKGMELVRELAARRSDLPIEVVGGSAEEVERWRARIPDGKVTFRGFADPGRVGQLLDRFGIMLAPYQERVLVGEKGVDVSRWMSPLKVFEYMAAGKPMVVSDLPALREFLRDGENALLVPPDRPDAWAAAVDRLIADGALRARLGENARREFLASYTWRRRAHRILDRLTSEGAV